MGLPEHVAIIMDGNGRWAQKRGLPRNLGHKRGVDRVEEIVKAARAKNIRALTLFAFSTENWTRPKSEIRILFLYLYDFLRKKKDIFHKQNIRVRFIGRKDRLPKKLQKEIAAVEAEPLLADSLVVNVALDYGGRYDIVNAARILAVRAARKDIRPEQIDEAEFSSCLSLYGLPEPDLLIRTSGEQRVSNFLLWQLAYAEFYFTDCLWPDFGQAQFEKALRLYSLRERRFGTISSGKKGEK